MRSWHREFFAMPTEVLELLDGFAAREGIRLLGRKAGEANYVVLSGSPRTIVDRFTLLPNAGKYPLPVGHQAAVGHTILDPPSIEDDALLMARIHLRTEREDDADVGVYRRLDREVRTLLVTPVVVENMVSGSSGKYPSILCSAAATTWAQSGRELRQRAVANLRFHPTNLDGSGTDILDDKITR